MILGAASLATASDLMQLIKPRVTSLVLATTACGLFLAPLRPEASLIFFTLLGTCFLVGAANALNMYLERDLDALMARTRNRPLPARRLSPRIALWFGIGLAVISVAILGWKTNRLTAALGLLAFAIYVLFYTPLKTRSHVALLVGAVPGATPPLIGWTAATGSITPPGLILFFVLFLWQVPHFLAITLFRQDEYQAAGIRVFPIERGIAATKQAIVRYLAGLLAVTLYPIPLGIAHSPYPWVALLTGSGFLLLGLFGLKRSAGHRWEKALFFASLLYLPILLITLIISK